jgi:hypothetical protein
MVSETRSQASPAGFLKIFLAQAFGNLGQARILFQGLGNIFFVSETGVLPDILGVDHVVP